MDTVAPHAALRPLDVAAVTDLVRRAAPRLGTVRLVLVDGPAGSGKTTAAARLADAFGGAPVVHMDDLYEGWSGLGGDVWDRLRRQVLEPLAAGLPGRYQRYDWDARRFAEWHDVPVPEILVVEGVGSAARPVDPWATLRIWVEVWPERALARGIARDGEPMRDEWLRWSTREREHFLADGTAGRADVLVDGSAPPMTSRRGG